jgi:hypothetical protein
MNKGGGPKIPTRAKMMICRMLVPIDLAAVSFSRSLQLSIGKLHWAIHAWILMYQVRFGRVHPCFSLTV